MNTWKSECMTEMRRTVLKEEKCRKIGIKD